METEGGVKRNHMIVNSHTEINDISSKGTFFFFERETI